jgi:hypothetical protein
MGLGPSKEKIRKILEKSMTNPNSNEQRNLKIEYKYKQGDGLDIEEAANNTTNAEGSDYQENGDSFNFSLMKTKPLLLPSKMLKMRKNSHIYPLGPF